MASPALYLTSKNRRKRDTSVPKTVSPHGDVVPRLRQLLAKAKEVWQLSATQKVTQKELARVTGLDPKTISAMADQRTEYYDERTIGLLCWYFGCDDPGQVLARIPPPGQPLPRLPEVRIGRTTPPLDAPPEPGTPLIQSRFAQQLARADIAEVTRVTGLARNTVVALMNKKRPAKRIARRTLAAALAYLDRKKRRRVKIAEVLVYCGPAPWRECSSSH